MIILGKWARKVGCVQQTPSTWIMLEPLLSHWMIISAVVTKLPSAMPKTLWTNSIRHICLSVKPWEITINYIHTWSGITPIMFQEKRIALGSNKILSLITASYLAVLFIRIWDLYKMNPWKIQVIDFGDFPYLCNRKIMYNP